jgi:hypothetical protein
VRSDDEENIRETLADIRAAVEIGFDQVERGEITPLVQAVVDEVKRRGRGRQAARHFGRKP